MLTLIHNIKHRFRIKILDWFSFFFLTENQSDDVLSLFPLSRELCFFFTRFTDFLEFSNSLFGFSPSLFLSFVWTCHLTSSPVFVIDQLDRSSFQKIDWILYFHCHSIVKCFHNEINVFFSIRFCFTPFHLFPISFISFPSDQLK